MASLAYKIMIYLDSFRIASEDDETIYKLSHTKQDMTCCSGTNAYPFGIFPFKELTGVTFEDVTVFYGGNGSGKSTLLNIIARKLGIKHDAPWNESVLFDDYLSFCSYKLAYRRKIPDTSRIVTSDDVFDFLLNIRSVNSDVSDRREKFLDEYSQTAAQLKSSGYRLKSLDDYEELKRNNEVRFSSKSNYVSKRTGRELDVASNGESAFRYFTDTIKENALYLLDEPENSLSAKLQSELAGFISDSARAYNCQFIICTHSPFMLSMRGAAVYDLDSTPARRRGWTELESVRDYRDFFKAHEGEF